ncbi:AAA family ATPase [Sulfurimonas gotlandica]|nr:AAA family ATPase [Sulfurimonas gotlandica]EDZ61675.1 hypothetical protein CBGD1_1755 [Sulfurimonas gotlandica GD1]
MIKWFIEHFPEYVAKMRECSYHYENIVFNLHHLEGDVWSHTVMSYNLGIKHKVKRTILWAILLHDLGRVFTRKVDSENSKVIFGDFEGVSSFVALEILKKANVPENEIIEIIKIISFQYTIIDHIKYNDPSFDELSKMFIYEEDLFKDLFEYVRCDLFGRIIDESKIEYYDINRVEQSIKKINQISKNKKIKTTKKNILYILVGPPCSRKSSWVNRKSKEFIIINRDSCDEEIGKKYGKHSYDEAYDFVKENPDVEKEADELYKAKREFAKNSKNKNIIIDNPNLMLSNRKKWITPFLDTHTIKVIVFLDSLENIVKCSKKRSIEINKYIDEKLIISKLKTFYFPLYSEGIDEIKYIFNKE